MFDGLKYPKFRWFDCNDPAIDSLVNEALGSLGQSTARGYSKTNIANRRIATRLLVLAMAVSGRNGLPVEVAIGHSKRAISRYPKGYKEALIALLSGGWVLNPVAPNPSGSWRLYDDAQGAINQPRQLRKQAKSWRGSPGCYSLSHKAWELLDSLGFDSRSVFQLREALIDVRDDNKVNITPLPENKDLDRWLVQLERYNQGLNAFKFSIEGQPLFSHDFSLHRVFNHGGYDKGGRYYSRSNNWFPARRKLLCIDGEGVVSSDFANLHARLSLAIAGEQCPDGDLYQFEGLDRSEVKAAWSAALNVSNNSGITYSPNSKQIIQAITQRFPKLKTVFGKGIGLLLQRADAEVVGTVLDAFDEAKRPIVPCHDGFYCLPKDQPLLMESIELGKLALFKSLKPWFPTINIIKLPIALG